MADQRKLPRSVVGKIYRLLDRGFSHRDIAKLCNCTRHTVGNYARKAVRPTNKRKEARPLGQKKIKLGRCPTHGAIELPCRACLALQFRENHPEREWVDPPPVIRDERYYRECQSQMDWFNDLDEFISEGLH